VYNTSRNFEDFGDLLSPEDEDILQVALDNAEDALDGNDLMMIQDAHDALHVAAQKLGTAIYNQGSSSASSSSTQSNTSSLHDDFLEEDTFDD